MLKLLAFLQTVMIAGLITLVLVLTNGTEILRSEIAAVEIEGESTDLSPLVRKVDALTEQIQDIFTALEFLALDVDGIKRNTWETFQALQAGGDGPEPEIPEAYERLFTPDTRETLVKLAAEKGVTLKEDRVEVPSIVIQDNMPLEFFAVTAGGKEHEAIIALVGNHDPTEGRMPEALAGMFNACILSLGYEKGTPVKVSRDGKVMPPQGEKIHLYLEWEENGETVRARAEDLVYNLDKRRTMERDKWVYVGSRFERDWGSGNTVYMADLTGDIAATYSWPNTIIDNTTSEGSDDIYYAACTSRIPKVGTKATFVVSREPLPAKDFPPIKLLEEDRENGEPEDESGK